MTGEVDPADLVGDIYESTLDPSRWPSIMARVGHAFNCHVGAVIFIANARGECVRILGSRDRQESIDDYAARWAGESAAAAVRGARPKESGGTARPVDIARATLALREGEVCTDETIIDRAALQRTTFFNEHLAKFDYYNAVGAKLWQSSSGSGILSLSRARCGGPFGGSELDALKETQSHLKRALAINQKLAWVQAGGRAAENCFERARCATLLLDEAGICGHLNTLAEALVAANRGVRIVKGRLQADDAAGTDALNRCIGLAIEGDAHGRRTGGAVSLKRRSSASPLAMLAVPVSHAYDWVLPKRPRALVTIVDPDERVAPAPEMLKALFRLTPSEVAVAIGIGRGRELKDVACELGLTPGSARQYLTKIYAKTHTSRQNDLSNLLTHLGAV